MKSAINVLADKHIYKIESFLPDEVNFTLFDPPTLLHDIPDGTQALFIRTTVTVDESFINNLPSTLQFIATASAGTDHIDVACLQKNNIAFVNAAGCNARAVGEYVATAVTIWADAKNIDLSQVSAGIIGAGHTGGQTQNILQSLGLETVAYDPPRDNREIGFQSASLNEVLNCDILTFHTPLTTSDNFPTFHWLDESKLNNHFQLIINASRGGVVDEQALLNAFKNNRVDNYILDVWENEPNFNDEVAKSAFIHTPHIAGYSVQGKLNASKIVADTFCNNFNLEKPNRPLSQNNKIQSISPTVFSIAELLKYLHPIDEYHQKFSTLIGQPDDLKSSKFSHIRTTHPLRNEYHSIQLTDQIKARFPKFFNIFKNPNR